MTEQSRSESGAGASRFLDQVAEKSQERFRLNRRILSFDQYLDLVWKSPQRYARNAAQYLRDCFDYFGYEDRETPFGTVRRYKLFDCPFDDGREQLIGQEAAQQEFYRVLTRFVKDGRIQRLALLHGPNGSAKSSFISCMMRALEAYSETDEGAIYRFNWVFPAEKIARGSIGFGGEEGISSVDVSKTYAFLDDLNVDAKLSCPLKDNPLLLFGKEERAAFLKEALGEDGEANFSAYIQRGELSHRSKKIYEALLASYQGDYRSVMRHVQVERFFLSHRYRVGAVTVEPQLRVDAGARQVTADRSLQSLPASLQNQTLFEPHGDLVDGNRGVVEYNDMFKRPPEYNRYLLSTSEKGTVALDQFILHLDVLLVGSANETYLDAFKKSPDYPSYKARFDLIRMPYLRDYTVEQKIYDEQIGSTEIGKEQAPHATYVAALWAVLTRLRRPNPDRYPSKIRGIVRELSPLQKARLYALGEMPAGLDSEKIKELRAVVEQMLNEDAGSAHYEGRYGVSPREMKAIILNAAQNDDFPHLSPLAIFDALRELIKDPTVYRFLQMEPEGLYSRHADFIDVVQEHYLDLIDEEVRSAMGLVDEGQYEGFFDRYIVHVTHWVKGEKIYNRTAVEYLEPDEKLMQEVEEKIGAPKDINRARNDIMSAIAAWALDHPGEPLDYKVIFPKRLQTLKESFYAENIEQLRRIKNNLLAYLVDEEVALNADEAEQVERTLDNLCAHSGHSRESAREAVMFLLRNRYND